MNFTFLGILLCDQRFLSFMLIFKHCTGWPTVCLGVCRVRSTPKHNENMPQRKDKSSNFSSTSDDKMQTVFQTMHLMTPQWSWSIWGQTHPKVHCKHTHKSHVSWALLYDQRFQSYKTIAPNDTSMTLTCGRSEVYYRALNTYSQSPPFRPIFALR